MPPAVHIPPETPCAHCGLPVGGSPVGEGPSFCCTGCSVVYAALQGAGFGETYYRLRDVASAGRSARPASTRVDALRLSELDSDAFLNEHTRAAGEDERQVELFLDGVHCAACVWLVERLPFEVEGVVEARLDVARARLALRWRPGAVRLSTVARWLARFGYRAHPARQAGQAQRTEAERRLLVRLGVAWALAGNVMLLAFAFYSGLEPAEEPAMASAARWLSFALSIPAVLYGGAEFFRRAWGSLRLTLRSRDLRTLHIDTPISLGILVGFAHSAWATLTGRGEVWFDSITVLIAALLTARWLQLRSRRLAGDATERLLSLIPSMVRRVGPEGTVEIVPAAEIRRLDLVEVPAGEVFPVDGLVETGASTVNNAVLTGESRPLPVGPGGAVEAGATNLSAPVRVRVREAGEGTRVGRLLAWIRDAETRRAPVVLLADRLSGWFVLAVLALSLATALLWLRLDPSRAAQHVAALLVITCPCALGMATPLAMTVAAGRAARAGLFIKSDGAIEQLTKVDCVVLDKTGTLTEGRLALAAWSGDEEALDLAALLEAHSNHPIAAALVEARAVRDLLPVESVEVTVGQGIRGRVAGREVAVGRAAWVETLAAPFAVEEARRLESFAARGWTPVAVAVDGRCAAALGFGDRLREGAKETIARLREAGHEVYLLSGDHEAVVRTVARELELAPERALGGVSPEEKLRHVERLMQEGGRTVAMIGDGVNDAAALQAAHVGVAVHGGSTASLVAADVFLTRDGIEPLVELIAGAGRVMGVVRRNLLFSLLYNAAGAAAAMLGLVTPLVAAVAMPLSSLVVVASSTLQRSFLAPRAPENRSDHERPLPARPPRPPAGRRRRARLPLGRPQRSV